MNHKQRVYLLLLCAAVATLVILALYQISDKVNNRSNAFIRQFPSHFISSQHYYDLKYNSYYIAGMDDGRIFLGNFILRQYLVSTNYQLTDTVHVQIKVKSPDSLNRYPYQFHLGSTDLYATNPVLREVLHAPISSTSVVKANNKLIFSAFTPAGADHFFFRTYNDSLQNNELISGSFNSSIQRSYKIPKQTDGFFSTDGILLYDQNLHTGVYVYYYHNQYICFDTLFRSFVQGKTIDTVAHARLVVREIPSEHIHKLGAPPLIVNKYAATDGDWLFINSGLKADNEDAANFRSNSVIDMYSLQDHHYHYSFYIPDFKGKKIRDMKVMGHRLVVINDHYLLTYQLNY